MITWDQAAVLRILDARETDVEERCAFLLGTRNPDHTKITFAYLVPNRHLGDRRLHFRCTTGDLPDVLHPCVLGVIHTHIYDEDAYPSQHDLDSMPANMFGIVYHPATRSSSIYTHRKVLAITYPGDQPIRIEESNADHRPFAIRDRRPAE